MANIRDLSVALARQMLSAPMWPMTLTIALVIVFLCVVIVLLKFRNRGFTSEAAIVRALGLRVLASIPVVESPTERAARRKRNIALTVASTMLAVAASAGLVWWRLRL